MADTRLPLQIQYASWGMLTAGVLTFATLMLGVSAPYGRYSRQGWGFSIPANLAWMTQEMWSFWVPLYLTARLNNTFKYAAPKKLTNAQVVLLAMFVGHYFYRAFLYGARIRGGKPTPVTVWTLATFFTLFNGWLQGWHILHFLPKSVHLLTWHFWPGAALWAAGLAINMQADNKLRSLRAKKDSGYVVPHGGLFEYVSCPNYLGEILEWAGFALASWSLPGAAFAFFTLCNLAPRAHQHHQWYRRRFPKYPASRRAVIPFVW